MEANTSLCRGSDVRISESPGQKNTNKKKYSPPWIWKFCLFGFWSPPHPRPVLFGDCFSALSFRQFFPRLLERICPSCGGSPIILLCRYYRRTETLIEFHNLSNIAPDENVLRPRWHIGLHLKGFRAADKFLLSGSEKQNNQKHPPHLLESWTNIPLSKKFLFRISIFLGCSSKK